jgi:hypothetical protein
MEPDKYHGIERARLVLRRRQIDRETEEEAK